MPLCIDESIADLKVIPVTERTVIRDTDGADTGVNSIALEPFRIRKEQVMARKMPSPRSRAANGKPRFKRHQPLRAFISSIGNRSNWPHDVPLLTVFFAASTIALFAALLFTTPAYTNSDEYQMVNKISRMISPAQTQGNSRRNPQYILVPVFPGSRTDGP